MKQSLHSLVCTQKKCPPIDNYQIVNVSNSQTLETTQAPISSGMGKQSKLLEQQELTVQGMRGPLQGLVVIFIFFLLIQVQFT